MSTKEAWLGELAFTLYARRLAAKSGLCYDFHWTMLPRMEQEAWMEMAKDIHEVGVNEVKSRRETRPDSSISPLAHSGSSFG